QAEDGIRDFHVTGVQTCALPISILRFSSGGIGYSQRHSRMSGWMPIERSSFTECWVGLVFISPAVLMKGSRVRWTKQERPRGKRSEERRVGKECRHRRATEDEQR